MFSFAVLVQGQGPPFPDWVYDKAEPPAGFKKIPLPDKAPPENVQPKGDANTGKVAGDAPPPAHTNDWRLHRQVDDKHNDIDLWVINETNIIYYALIFSNATGRYLIGKCPFEGGRNRFAKADTGDTNPNNNNPDEFTGAFWASVDGGKDDDNDGDLDMWVYTFDVKTNKVTADHYEDGVKQADSLPPTEPKISPFKFSDLPPANPGVNYTYGDIMYPMYPEVEWGVGGMVRGVDFEIWPNVEIPVTVKRIDANATYSYIIIGLVRTNTTKNTEDQGMVAIDTQIFYSGPGETTIAIFNWNETNVPGGGWELSAEVYPVSPFVYDTDLSNNKVTYGQVRVLNPGDTNGDKLVDVADLVVMISHIPSSTKPYDPLSDLNADGLNDITDLVTLIAYIPTAYPY